MPSFHRLFLRPICSSLEDESEAAVQCLEKRQFTQAVCGIGFSRTIPSYREVTLFFPRIVGEEGTGGAVMNRPLTMDQGKEEGCTPACRLVGQIGSFHFARVPSKPKNLTAYSIMPFRMA